MERSIRPLYRPLRPLLQLAAPRLATPCRRYASTNNSQQDQELESASSLATMPDISAPESFDALERARRRPRQLPRSRYQFRSPRYYRGPLHPHQPPRPADPASRLFRPGPFQANRLAQTIDSTIAADYMTLVYQHFPPGHQAAPRAERLRKWEGDSPYFKNRPLRGPRGHTFLPPVKRPITFRNIPRLERVTVSTMVSAKKAAIDVNPLLQVASMALQAVTGAKVEPRKSKNNVLAWNLRADKYMAVVCELRGDEMHNFVSKCIDVLMPKIKDWRGVKGSSGDSAGNITFGLSPEQFALFPEIEVNYDAYPPNMIPGCNITFHTTAKFDREARLLLSAIGVPFYGKLIN